MIELDQSDIKKLQSLIHNKKTSKSIIRRCQILLELATNHLNQQQISNTFDVSKVIVSNIVKDYAQHGLDYTITYHRNPNSNAKVR